MDDQDDMDLRDDNGPPDDMDLRDDNGPPDDMDDGPRSWSFRMRMDRPFEGTGQLDVSDEGLRFQVETPMNAGRRVLITLIVGLGMWALFMAAGIFCWPWVMTFWVLYFVIGYIYAEEKTLEVGWDEMEDPGLEGHHLTLVRKRDRTPDRGFEVTVHGKDRDEFLVVALRNPGYLAELGVDGDGRPGDGPGSEGSEE